MHAVDTNVLVRLIARDDVRQTAIAQAFVNQGVWVSILALAEAVWVLDRVYKQKASDIANAIEMLLNHADVTVQNSDTVVAALELFRSRPALRFTDCLVLQLARSAGHLPLGTFDRALARVEGTQRL